MRFHPWLDCIRLLLIRGYKKPRFLAFLIFWLAKPDYCERDEEKHTSRWVIHEKRFIWINCMKRLSFQAERNTPLLMRFKDSHSRNASTLNGFQSRIISFWHFHNEFSHRRFFNDEISVSCVKRLKVTAEVCLNYGIDFNFWEDEQLCFKVQMLFIS